jgi:transposase InsO family protein
MSVSKQSFSQMLERRARHLNSAKRALYPVEAIRKNHPRMSVREIYYKIHPLGIGRDKFEAYCFARGYRVKKIRNYRRTTDSRGVTRFPNLIKELEVTAVNQVLVSDITYYNLHEKPYYVTLIMDLFNREVVGYSASKSLRAEDTTLPALQLAILSRGKAALKGAIFHSDGGGQYYANDFKKVTKSLKMSNSMTEETVYENAHAERLNGTIKNSYLYEYAPSTFEELQKELKRAVFMYNNEKPHAALKGMSPVQYRNTTSVEIENNSPERSSYFPISTEKQHQQVILKTKKNNNRLSNLVNVFQA